MPTNKLPGPDFSGAMFNLHQQEQILGGIRRIQSVLTVSPAVEPQAFLETLVSHQNTTSPTSLDMLHKGLTEIELARTMDDDGYTPKPEPSLLERDNIRAGARAILETQASLDPTQAGLEINDETVDKYVVLLENSENSSAAKDMTRAGLQKIALSSTLE